tara:strand:+ start:890 stop:1810 length:921 start_codon:yes stop_codon:yes gene_type:complete
MNLIPKNQLKLYGLNDYIDNLISLYQKNLLPNKILLSGSKGIGKCTLSYHFINYVFSKNEDYSYDINNYTIIDKNKSYKLIQNGSHPNFSLIDIDFEKKNIDINQIRELIKVLNKSSFKNEPKFILIDNIEYLNLNSVNALLKILEEPNEDTYFILINNNKQILPTIKSRCLDFKISLSNSQSTIISNQLLGEKISNLIHSDYLDYYFTPGFVLNLIEFSKINLINIKEVNLDDFLKKIINENLYKKKDSSKYVIYYLIELFLKRKTNLDINNYYFEFIHKINNVNKFNLDEESFFIDLETKVING